MLSRKRHIGLNFFSVIYALILQYSFLANGFANSNNNFDNERPNILDSIEKQGLRVVGEMQVPGGLRGFAAKAGSQPLAIYVTPDNNYAIIGTLVDAEGQDVASEQFNSLLKVPFGAEEWKKLENSTWVLDGKENAPRVVYTFTDPNCPYCNKFWHAARPWVNAGKVQLRHILVGVIRQDSPGKAAAILKSGSPEQALTRNEIKPDGQGIAPLEIIDEEVASKLNNNEQLMTDLGFGGTPAIIYKKDNGSFVTIAGLPEGETFKAMFGPQ